MIKKYWLVLVTTGGDDHGTRAARSAVISIVAILRTWASDHRHTRKSGEVAE